MKLADKKIHAVVLLFITLGIGFLLALQFRSFTLVKRAFLRDRNPNIFREIQVLKNVTDKLRNEKDDLEANKAEFKSRYSTIEAVKKELAQYKLLSGEIAVTGPGIRIVIPKAVDTVWFTDLANSLIAAGAEAVAINSERIGSAQAGFRVIGGKTLLLGDRVLRPPFRIEAIGDRRTLAESLLQPDSVLRRLEQTLKNQEIFLTQEGSLLFNAIL